MFRVCRSRKISLFVFIAALLFISLSGCSKEQVSRSLYEGVKMKGEADREPDDPAKMPTYDEYQRDRQGIINEGKTE
jgi:hypothetical protein